MHESQAAMTEDFQLDYEPIDADDAQERITRAVAILIAAGQRARLATQEEKHDDRYDSRQVPHLSDDRAA